jgi:CheY-like chemotaxis protein
MPSLLVVDDDREQLQLQKRVLEHAGHEVRTAATIAEAARLLAESRPDVLLMDLYVPNLKDGLALIRTVEEQQPATKILVLSGWSLDFFDTPEQKLVHQVLDKPVRTELLLRAISDMLR